ncbi:LacI family DNA-binding transcriptional regulator [Clostridium butyricum]
MVTIKDIAKAVNVSCTTVSNVIHGKAGRVSAETIIKIENAIKELGYVPNMSARSLVSNSSKVIGVINHIIPNNKNFMEDPFHSLFIGALESTLRENGYYLMLRTVETNQDLDFFLRNWNLDGLILTGVYEDNFYTTLTKLNIPIVLIDSYVSSTNICNVGLEDLNGGYLATKYLIDRGHTNIVFASPFIKYKGVVSERFEGYKRALLDSNIEFNENLVFEQEIDIDTTIALGRKLAKRNDFTAIFATADILACGIITGLRQCSKKIPEDISIIGFDDINLCKLTSPSLTTIHQDLPLKGKIAANYIIETLEKKSIAKTKSILPVKLVERESVRTITKF